MKLHLREKPAEEFRIPRFSWARLFVFGGLVFVYLIVLPASAMTGAKELSCGICGEPIDAVKYIRLSNGKTYHKDCFEHCQWCPICSLPIGKDQESVPLTGDRLCHLSCFVQADFCGICGEPICAGEEYGEAEKSGTLYHVSCFDSVPKCGLTGQPITPGTEYVCIGNETFLKSAYEKSKKCLVSGLPISNHGKYLKNSRTETYVLEKFVEETRECYSCGDHLIDGFQTENNLFLCSYCYENGIRDSRDAQPYINMVIKFFRESGLAVPENIEIRILPPGRPIDKDQPGLKGRCRPHCLSRNGEPVSLSYGVKFIWGLNPAIFARVAAHELAHTIIGNALINRHTCEKPEIPYEEGRCEYASYTFAKGRNLPEYIIDAFGENQVENYREEFLYVRAHSPENLKVLLTSVDF